MTKRIAAILSFTLCLASCTDVPVGTFEGEGGQALSGLLDETSSSLVLFSPDDLQFIIKGVQPSCGVHAYVTGENEGDFAFEHRLELSGTLADNFLVVRTSLQPQFWVVDFSDDGLQISPLSQRLGSDDKLLGEQ